MNTVDAAWIVNSAALVLFMVPGLALFYGGMSRSENMVNMLMMNMVCLGLAPVVWITVGYTLSSSDGDSTSRCRRRADRARPERTRRDGLQQLSAEAAKPSLRVHQNPSGSPQSGGNPSGSW